MADLSLAGHKVNLFELPEFEENIEPIREKDGIDLVRGESSEEVKDISRTGYAELKMVTTDIQDAVSNVDRVLERGIGGEINLL